MDWVDEFCLYSDTIVDKAFANLFVLIRVPNEIAMPQFFSIALPIRFFFIVFAHPIWQMLCGLVDVLSRNSYYKGTKPFTKN